MSDDDVIRVPVMTMHQIKLINGPEDQGTSRDRIEFWMAPRCHPLKGADLRCIPDEGIISCRCHKCGVEYMRIKVSA